MLASGGRMSFLWQKNSEIENGDSELSIIQNDDEKKKIILERSLKSWDFSTEITSNESVTFSKVNFDRRTQHSRNFIGDMRFGERWTASWTFWLHMIPSWS